MLTSYFMAWIYPNCAGLFSILGAFFGTLIIVTMPGMMYAYHL